jgi:transposase
VIEAEARFQPPAVRLQIRAAARPLVSSFFAWAESQLGKLYAKSALAATLRDTLKRRAALTRFLDHGCLEIDNQCTEAVLRRIRLSERSWTLADCDAAGEHAAAIYSIIGSASLNRLDLHTYLKDVLRELIEGKTTGQIDHLLPWNWSA